MPKDGTFFSMDDAILAALTEEVESWEEKLDMLGMHADRSVLEQHLLEAPNPHSEMAQFLADFLTNQECFA